jgi:hypothetical protein
MRNKIIIIGLIAIIFSSCISPSYLPSSDNIDINKYGSYIKITRQSNANIDGELIAIDSNKIVVLSESENECLTVPITEVKQFKLRYAKPKNYSWSIPAYTFFTLMHGLLLIFTAPINLIVTISVKASGESAFRYSDKNMTYEKLKMFARFPQGIPTNINMESIK